MKEISKQSKSEKTISSLDFSIFFVVCWTVTAFFASPFLGIEWFVAGDFNYSEAMYYHAVMIPILILLYLLIIKILPLNLAKGRTYAV